MSNSKQFTKCLITGNNDLKPLKGYEKDYLVKSKSSGFVFCSRIATEKELLDYYSSYPVGYNSESEITRIRINELLDGFEKYRKTNRILDVGCGPGLFLIEAKKRNWDVYGTEFTIEQTDYLKTKGIKTSLGKLQSNSFEKESFDVIISSEVIEHINNPIEEMKLFNFFLRKGGLTYITTPNFNAIERFILKGRYNIILYPEHLSYYTPKTIDLLLSKTGFQKVKIKTTGISISRIKNSLSKTSSSHKDNINNDEALRQSLETGYKKHIKSFINWILTTLGIGSSMKVWYEKK
ncbi:MAG: class I SAM-dependent methyltransferase [Vicingaceae bacterium]|nr:class I SAM-dependent methyltransferase [Vicingaceae bacterium]